MEQEEIMDDNDRGMPAGGSESNRESHDPARTNGAATSAMVRDAARLRTVMTRASDRESSREASAITVPLPEPDHRTLERSGYGATKLAMPRQASASSLNVAEAAQVAAGSATSGGATRLRPVATLSMVEPNREKPVARAMAHAAAAMPVSTPTPAEPRPSAHATTQSSQASTARNDVWDAVSTATVPKVASDSWDQIPHGAYREKKRGIRKGFAAACTVLGGSVIGLALYVGGSDFLSGIFSNRTEGVQMRSPSAVTERPQTPVVAQIPPAVQDSMPVAAVVPEAAIPETVTPAATERRVDAMAESPSATAPVRPLRPAPAEQERRAQEVVPAASATRPSATAVTETARRNSNATPRNETRTGVTNPPKRENGGNQQTTRTASTTREERTPASSKYMVQVRATPNEDEAKRVAKKLRSKGVGNVQVVRSEKDGAPFYRVRFTGAGTSSEAKAKAKGAGFSDIWVVKQD